MRLHQEVRPPQPVEAPCVHHDPVQPWGLAMLVLIIAMFTGFFAFTAGHARGYRDAVEQGYCQP